MCFPLLFGIEVSAPWAFQDLCTFDFWITKSNLITNGFVKKLMVKYAMILFSFVILRRTSIKLFSNSKFLIHITSMSIRLR